jgi:uncharacterized flavoprotein (TIGR03862 family)
MTAEQSSRTGVAAEVAVIGAGPAGLMAAETLVAGGARVTVFDRMPTAGRKFLLAGRGGLNLTHTEPLEDLLARYGAAASVLRPAITAFPPAALRAWCEGLGQPTFVGSSGRVFPRAFKSSPLLRAWLGRLAGAGVSFRMRHRWLGLGPDRALDFVTPAGGVRLQPAAVILALGGASWPRLGADGGWVEILTRAGIAVARLRPANCGFAVDWSERFRMRFQGQPLKRIALTFSERTVRGEAVVTGAGLEGGAVYALSAPLREALAATGAAVLHIDLRPDVTADVLGRRLGAARGKQSFANFVRKSAGLAPVAIGLLQEAVHAAAQRPSELSPAALAGLIKSIPLRLTATAPLARAISTAGGIALTELDDALMLRRCPGIFAAGEMLDWEAPTGGYLLQAAFATGAAAAHGALAWLARSR